MKIKTNLDKLLNIGFAKVLNHTVCCGEMDMPELICDIDKYPDYIALYKDVSQYHATENTCVAFYHYDSVFDGKNGIFQSIYNDNIKALDSLKKKFEGVRYIITPDYSILGDLPLIENIHRIYKARLVGAWFMQNTSAIAIPNISIADKRTEKYALDGLEKCTAVAFSTKGHMNSSNERKRLEYNIKATVDRLNLKAIIVYDVCSDNIATLKVFDYAIQKGIKIIIPDNSLKERNRCLMKGKVAGVELQQI